MVEPLAITDSDLVTRFRAGDELAFGQLIELYGTNLLAFLRRQNLSEAEDLCQDTWMKAWAARERFLGGNFRAWLFTIARNNVIERSRKKRPDLNNDVAEAKATYDQESSEYDLDALKEAMLQLKAECRELIRGFYFDGSSYEQLGRTLSLPGGTVASRMSRCRQHLRDEIERKAK